MNVKECMKNNICTCTPSTNITDVAKLMKENHVGCIPVCDDSKEIVGLVTDRDIILRGVACGKDANTTPISEIMTTGVHWCDCNQDVKDATQMMSNYQVKRIPVVDQNKIIGILTLGDIANNEKVSNYEVEKTVQNICECSNNAQNAE